MLKQAQSGGDFVKLAAKYSDDPSNKLQGGDLGTFGRGQMIKPFEDAVFAMKPGQIAMVETHYGFHVVRLDDRPARRTPTRWPRRSPKIVDELRTQAGAKLGRTAAQEDLTAALAGANLATSRRSAVSTRLRRRCSPQGEPVGGIEQDRELVAAAFKLEAGRWCWCRKKARRTLSSC